MNENIKKIYTDIVGNLKIYFYGLLSGILLVLAVCGYLLWRSPQVVTDLALKTELNSISDTRLSEIKQKIDQKETENISTSISEKIKQECGNDPSCYKKIEINKREENK